MTSSTLFTDDILLDIFTYLPLKSIDKFKCLSKVWLSNLSNPNFIIRWYHINNKSLPWIQYDSLTHHGYDENLLRFGKAYYESYSDFISINQHLFNFKFLMNQKPFQGATLFLLGSSNGLVLCWSSGGVHGDYHVCNPLTKKWVTLPVRPHSRFSPYDIHGIFCEYSSSFASSYMVIHIPQYDLRRMKFNVDVFSSDLGVWQNIEVLCDKDVGWSRSRVDNVVIFNGVLYWIDGLDKLLVCNMNHNNGSGTRRCNLIDLPDNEFGEHATDYDSALGESEGRVCYARIRISGKELTVSSWVLDGVNWKVVRKDISVENILAKLPSRRMGERRQFIQVLGFSPVERNVVLLGWKHWYWGFNIQTRSIEELCSDNKHKYGAGVMYFPFMLKPMPTALTPHSWI